MIIQELRRILENVVNENDIKNILFKLDGITYTFEDNSNARIFADIEREIVSVNITKDGKNISSITMRYENIIDPLTVLVSYGSEYIWDLYETITFIFKYRLQDYSEELYQNDGFSLTYEDEYENISFIKTDIMGLYRVLDYKYDFVNYIWITQQILEEIMKDVI